MNRDHKNAFEAWMRAQFRSNGTRQYAESTVSNYLSALNNIHKRLPEFLSQPLFSIGDPSAFQAVEAQIRSAADFDALNHSGNGALSAALSVYAAFLKAGAPASSPNGAVPAVSQAPKNLILYGPPGTGKTYHTVHYAVALLEDRTAEDVGLEPYDDVLARYRAYKQDGLIEFCTFHQSYGYEEFIEGIRPTVAEDGGMQYRVEPGLFKKFCDKATAAAAGQSDELGIRENPTVWKVSLQGTGDNPIRTDCMKNGHIRIDWSSYGGELSGESEYKDGGKSILNAFINGMQVGDIVMSCYSENEVDAIGVITDDYQWVDSYDSYKRLRKVNWLVTGIRENIRALNGGKKMTLSTVYRLNQLSLPDVLGILRKYRPELISDTRRRVFIVDEINRGDISKIFGELITLIEPSKRLDAPEELKVRLPYSGAEFGIPGNVYLLGTMNTADRSIALLDTALRRRFSFVEMPPQASLLAGLTVDGIDISALLTAVNQRIEALFDRDHTIGHAYFMELWAEPTQAKLADIFAYSILPLLQEYFYEDYEKIRIVLGDNRTDDATQQFVQRLSPAGFGFPGDPDLANDVYRVNHAALYNADAYRKIYAS